MTQWHRHTPFGADHGREWEERWEYTHGDAVRRMFDVQVRAGKPLDVLKLKGIDLGEVRDYAGFLETTAARLYGAGAKVRRMTQCPLCHASLDGAAVELAVFGVPYLRCGSCCLLYTSRCV